MDQLKDGLSHFHATQHVNGGLEPVVHCMLSSLLPASLNLSKNSFQLNNISKFIVAQWQFKIHIGPNQLNLVNEN